MFLVHTPPSQAEVVARGLVGACRLGGWSDPTQPGLLHALFNRLLGKEYDFDSLPPLPVEEVARSLRSASSRREFVELMAVLQALCNPVPEALDASVIRWAAALEVEGESLRYVHRLARGEVAKAAHDFYRHNWISDLDRRDPAFGDLLARFGDPALATTVEPDPALAARWRGLAGCPPGSIGRCLSEFYDARGFGVPGELGAVNGAVAQHDWIHLLSNYGTTPLGEVEVLSFQSTATRAPGAMLGMVGVIALLDSGLMPAGLITRAPDLRALGSPDDFERVAEAIERGTACNTDLLLDVDFFAVKDEPLDALRVRFGIPPKSSRTELLDPEGAGFPWAPGEGA